MTSIREMPPPEPLSERFTDMMAQFVNLQCRYQSAIRQVRTKLEIMDEEFQIRNKRNPIHHMQSRMKTFPSIIDKLKRKGLPVTLDAAVRELTDIAGIRVVCAYINDIYALADMLISHDDIRLLCRRDYIRDPKDNGYRSLHLIIEVPVYLTDGKVFVPVEVQIRTIAMDFWASLEHQLRYKVPDAIPEALSEELRVSAEEIARIDYKMQSIHDAVSLLTQ